MWGSSETWLTLGDRKCYRNAKGYHKEDGPAVIHSNSGTVEYWIDGEKCTVEDYPLKLLEYKLIQIIET